MKKKSKGFQIDFPNKKRLGFFIRNGVVGGQSVHKVKNQQRVLLNKREILKRAAVWEKTLNEGRESRGDILVQSNSSPGNDPVIGPSKLKREYLCSSWFLCPIKTSRQSHQLNKIDVLINVPIMNWWNSSFLLIN